MLDVESKVSLQQVSGTDEFFSCTMERQNVFQYEDNDSQCATYGDTDSQCATYGDTDSQCATYGDNDSQCATYGDTDSQCATYGDSDSQCATYGDSDSQCATYGDSDIETMDDTTTFLDISNNMKPAAYTEIKTEPDTDTLMSWTQKHPEHWSQNEILDWIYFVANTINVDPTTVRGEGFQNITGPELCRMTQEDFQRRDPVNGKCFYDMFRSLHRHAFFSEPPRDYEYSYQPNDIKQEIVHDVSQLQSESQYNTSQNNSVEPSIKLSDMEVLIGKAWFDIEPCTNIAADDIEKMARHILSNEYDYEYGSSDSESHSDASETLNMCNRFRNDSTGSDGMSDDDISHNATDSDDSEPKSPRSKPAVRRKPGDKRKIRGRKPGQMSKGNHLWEFVRDLLRDPTCNPEILKWEEKDTGVFRFVQSEKVARLWGKKKSNKSMTYEKLSRAMRFCRTAGYFAEVPKTGKFPKKLCFRFGAKAFGWKD